MIIITEPYTCYSSRFRLLVLYNTLQISCADTVQLRGGDRLNSDIITSQAATRWRPDNQWLQVAKKILTLRSEREGYCGGLCPPGGGELIPFMDRTQIIFTSFIKNLRYLVNGYMSFFIIIRVKCTK